MHLQRGPFGHFPFGQQGVGHLLDFNVVERFLQDQQPVMGIQAIEQIVPGIIGVGGTDHYLQLRILLPQVFDGFCPVPAVGHTHVDKRQRVGALFL
ncbi:hypothetical protein D3C80_1897580 [compost metagenome]